MKSSPPLTFASINEGVSPTIPSDYKSLRDQALLTYKNLTFEALTDPLAVKLMTSVDIFPKTDPVP